ncbi:kinase-like protein [Daldinia loculata]|uniref:kinase-like protein n=1 Tax=Daldinia loculata TaxID=103429 RepID=UPI0020C2D529|nr:kinase-like protein [Daldinia loculata]KAI1644296.1 kinase-like protein [Daldinia loculata]
MDSDPDYDSWKYLPFELGECEDLENYEPGGFHPVHLGDVYDRHYRVVHKLGFGGFSTVWLARETITNRWVALKIVAARESPTYEDRSVIARNPSIAGSRLFVTVDRQFWIDGPNGRHLCLVLPALGPDLSKLSRGIYSRVNPAFAREVSLQAARALIQLHLNGLCHGDFTVSNMALRLINEFDLYEEDYLFELFGRPQTAPLRTYSGDPPGPHGPKYIVVPLDFCSSATNLLSSEICIIDFDQSFTITGPPLERPGIPAKYLAPEIAVGRPASPASDIWALGCAIFRIRSGDDLFFDYDTDTPTDALRQIVKALGELPEEWKQTRFDEEGVAVADGERGELFWSLEETRSLDDRVRGIIDEPLGLFINRLGEAVNATDEKPGAAMFDDDAALREPYSPALSSIVWKPTAVCVAGTYFIAYSDELDGILEAFPRISELEASLLVDLLSKVFTYDPATRLKAEELVTHPWFYLTVTSGSEIDSKQLGNRCQGIPIE